MPTTCDLVQVIVEETPRYEGAATTTPYRLSSNVLYLPVQSASLQPGPTHDDRSDEVRCIPGGAPLLISGYEPEGSIGMRAYANPLTYLISIGGWVGTVTPGDGIITDPDGATIPTGAYRWVFTKRPGLTAKTAQIRTVYADEGQFIKGQGYGITGWTLNAAGEYSADLMGLVYVRETVDPNLTASFDSFAIPHFRRGDLTVSWLAGGGAVDDFELSFPNPLERRSSMGLATPSYFPDRMEHGDEQIIVTGSIPKSELDNVDIDALLNATSFAAEARWISPKSIGATAKKYSLWVEMPNVQYSGGTIDDIANVRRFGADFDFRAAWDDTAGYDVKITLVNGVAAIETYA